MTEERKCVGAFAPPRESQGRQESTRAVEMSVPRRGSVPPSEQTRSDNVSIETFVDRQGESSGGIGNSVVAEGEESVGLVEPRRESKETPESHAWCGEIY